MLTLLAVLFAAAGLVLAGLAVDVARRGTSRAGISLAVLLVAVAWWGVAYSLEFSADDLDAKNRWGDLKYLGIGAVAPAWAAFVLQYTGRERHLTRPVLVVVAVEPLLLLLALAVPATHDLVRYYPEEAAGDPTPVVAAGPLFWAHLAYVNVVILVVTGLFVATMWKLSRTYHRLAIALVVAALLPWVANILYNFEVGALASIDLTPFAFTVTGGVLVWGLHRERLVRLAPLARGVVVDSMVDGVLVLDAFGRLVDVNPAGRRLLGPAGRHPVGRRLGELLPALDTPLEEREAGAAGPGQELRTGRGPEQRTHDVARQPLTDPLGRPAGELVVLRDITERVRADARVQELLREQSRVAAALQVSLTPRQLPEVPEAEVSSRYEPAGDGREIGGDFYDVFPLDDQTWGIVLGDVSGKGAEAAAVTAQARYTLRALAHPQRPPSATLRDLNARMLNSADLERHCTLVYALARPGPHGTDLTLSLAGHHPPLVLRPGHGQPVVEPVGEPGTASGLLEDPELHDVTTRLAPGDMVCFFTDGLVEARQGPELFGSEGVTRVMLSDRAGSPEELAGALVDAARAFHQGPWLADDLAILVLRAAGEGAGPAPFPVRETLAEDGPSAPAAEVRQPASLVEVGT